MISLVWRATYANGDGTNVLRDSKFKYEFIELLKIACQRNEWVSKCIGFDNESKRDWSVGTNRRVRQVRDRFTKATDTITATDSSPISEERQTWRAIHHGFASRKDFNGIAAILLRIVLLLTLQVRSDLKACSVSSPTERLLSRYFSNQVAP
jgi:hypothetical protein